MKKDIELFIEKVASKEIREVLEKHLSEILKDDTEKEVILMVDKKYALNELHTSSEVEKLAHAVHKVYGEEYSLTLKVDLLEAHNERTMFIPHTIRY